MPDKNWNKDWYEKHLEKEAEDKERSEANARKVHRGLDAFMEAYPDSKWAHYIGRFEVMLPTLMRDTCIEPGYHCARILTPSPNSSIPTWDVLVNNGDDRYLRKICKTEDEAKQSMEQLISFAPATYDEIFAMNVGFQYE